MEMKRIYPQLIILILYMGVGCETEYTPPILSTQRQIVVEGYIEAAESNAVPTYVILTRDLPYFEQLGRDQLDELYVRGAKVTVTSDAGLSVPLQELCLLDLDPVTQQLVRQFLGFSLNNDSIGVNFCAYADLFGAIKPEQGRTYELKVEVDGQVITASTTIPKHVGLDSLKFTPTPGQGIDSLAQLLATIDDPADVNNYYRYLSRINNGSYASGFNSITDDIIFNGKKFEFRLNKPESSDDSADDDQQGPETFGLWHRGDTISIKWCSIDKGHFDFWNTLEFNRNNQGPFSSYTRIISNIKGGLGIWGGLSAEYYELVVPEL